MASVRKWKGGEGGGSRFLEGGDGYWGTQWNRRVGIGWSEGGGGWSEGGLIGAKEEDGGCTMCSRALKRMKREFRET